MSDFWKETIDEARALGWDNKDWARHTGIIQKYLDAITSGSYPDDTEVRDSLRASTKEHKKDKPLKLLRFASPVIIASCTHKGGGGKTTCSVALADELARRGYNVLLIDSDSQMDATSTLLPNEEAPEKNLFPAITNGSDICSQICETKYPRLDIVPSSTRMASVEAMLISQEMSHYATKEEPAVQLFKKSLQGLVAENYYDFVFVDMDKTVGALNRTILTGCTHLLMTAECSYYHMVGTVTMKSQYESVKSTSNPDLELLGVVFNKVSKRKAIVNVAISDFDESMPGARFESMIRNDTNIEKAQWSNMTLHEYNASCNGSKDFCAVADEMLGRLAHLDISKTGGKKNA